MAFLTRETFRERVILLNSNYWNEGWKYRWQYMSQAIEWARELRPMGIVEAGASGIPLDNTSVLLDYPEYDLNLTPYNFPYKSVDLFIALQTWEHLDKQSDAFREVMRISKAAILSFPYRWTWGDERHRGVGDAKISEWTCGVAPDKVAVINHRKVCLWMF